MAKFEIRLSQRLIGELKSFAAQTGVAVNTAVKSAIADYLKGCTMKIGRPEPSGLVRTPMKFVRVKNQKAARAQLSALLVSQNCYRKK